MHLLTLGGATLIQLREKQLPSLQLYELAKAAVATARKTGAQLIVNDRVDIAMAIGAHGVHLGQDDMPPEAARRLLGAEAIIGYSTHTIEQAQHALTLPVDYIAIGMTKEYMVDDQRHAASRPDVLVYQTEPLKEDVVLSGPFTASLAVSTTGTDSDFVVKLITPPPVRPYWAS